MKLTLYERYVLSLLLVRENTKSNNKVEFMYESTEGHFQDVFAEELRSLQKKQLIEFVNREFYIAPKNIAFVKSWYMQIKRPHNFQVADLFSNIIMSLEELNKRDINDNTIYQSILKTTIESLSKKIKT